MTDVPSHHLSPNSSETILLEVHDLSSISSESILSASLERLLYFVFVYGIQIPVLIFGIGTNIVNILVFGLSGQRDSVSISFTALAISDLGYSVIFGATRIIGLIDKFNFRTGIRLGYLGLAQYTVHYNLMFLDISFVITVFLAVQKCCCVAIPHHFKNTFTPVRTVAIIICLSAIVALSYMPVLVSMSFLTIRFPSNSNQTIISLRLLPMYTTVLVVYRRIFNLMILPFSCQFISIICLIIMIVQLKKSARFRNLSEEKDDCRKDKFFSTKLSKNERRALTAVALVLGISVVFPMPAIIIAAVMLWLGDIATQPRYANLSRFVNQCPNILINVNAAINIFVYLKYNTRYKETALKLASPCNSSES